MLRGLNELNLDAKGRMAVPARYRQDLMDGCNGQLVVTVDRDNCLLIYPMTEWEIVEKKLAALPSFDQRTRKLQRLLIGHATEVELDASGRLLVPPPLREYARLDKRVVLIGQGNKFELWDNQYWVETRQKWLDEDDDLSQDLESLSI